MLKPAPEAAQAEACARPCAPAAAGARRARGRAAAAPRPPRPPIRSRRSPHGEKKKAAELAYVPMDKPFVVPVFAGEKVVAMVVLSLSVETETEAAPTSRR